MGNENLAAILSTRARGCFMCRWALEDLVQHGKFTDRYPKASNLAEPLYPASAKMAHLRLEGVYRELAVKNKIS